MKSSSRRYLQFLFALLASCAASSPALAVNDPECVRLGILSTVGNSTSTQSFAETVKVLENVWQRRIELSYYDLDSLPQAVRDKKLDYFISNPGIFSHMQLLGQARHLATLKIAQADDPNFSLGGVFFVRSDDEQIRTFEDMRGKSALAVAPNAFGGLAVHLGEIRARGYDPEHFFASISYTGYPMQSVFEQMRQGRSRVGMVRTCLIEEMTDKGLLAKDEFRVIGAKNDPRLRCSTSTELYPDWVFAATTEAKPEQSRQACAALFSLSDEMGGYWSVASDFTRIDELFRELRIGHYRYLRQWTFERVWMQYRWVVLGLSALLFLGFWHTVFVTFEVRRKTKSLRAVMAEREKAQNEVIQTQNRLQSLERASLVGMLSNMVAHELKQPLGAIANFADGIRTFAERGSSEGSDKETFEMIGGAASEIIGQTRRAGAVIDRVRGYAKTGVGRNNARVELKQVVEQTVRDFRLLAKNPPEIFVQVPVNAFVSADAVELSLVILNLFKNAADAMRGVVEPCIEVGLEDHKSVWRLTIADNGPTVDVSAFQDLFSPKLSTKSTGLGMGLAISARIMEACGGRLSIERNDPIGLKAVLTLPKYLNEVEGVRDGHNLSAG